MKRIKTIVSFLCAAALALTLLVMPSSASGGLFFLSLNDTLPAQSVQMTPVQRLGVRAGECLQQPEHRGQFRSILWADGEQHQARSL